MLSWFQMDNFNGRVRRDRADAAATDLASEPIPWSLAGSRDLGLFALHFQQLAVSIDCDADARHA